MCHHYYYPYPELSNLLHMNSASHNTSFLFSCSLSTWKPSLVFVYHLVCRKAVAASCLDSSAKHACIQEHEQDGFFCMISVVTSLLTVRKGLMKSLGFPRHINLKALISSCLKCIVNYIFRVLSHYVFCCLWSGRTVLYVL